MDSGYSYVNQKGIVYYLHAMDIDLRHTGRTQRIYFFSKNNIDGASMPKGYHVIENLRSHLPFLKKD